MTNATNMPIEPFDGEYMTRMMNAAPRWSPCRVIGVTTESATAQAGFVILIEQEDGTIYVSQVDFY
ncbi:hypothetical protein [Mesorhizobium sp. INR15]|uniref:hypothetical protein n=1 Tax=Mesorhizobium sp. INR15 TaxID=2654248 RepID=UPI0018968050|nr:hypothetical protein [Mesorhizobium sp. INR15]QPC93531.1 hypothetical protein GA829_24780 [Mesorhizobium sp. INR15]